MDEIKKENLQENTLYKNGSINEKYLLKGLHTNNSLEVLQEILSEGELKDEVWKLSKKEFYALAIKSNRQSFTSKDDYKIMIERIQAQYKLGEKSNKEVALLPFVFGLGMILPYLALYLTFSGYGDFTFPYFILLTPIFLGGMLTYSSKEKTLFKMWYFFNIKDDTMITLHKYSKYAEWFIGFLFYLFANLIAISQMFF